MRIMARKTGSHADITGPKVRAAALRLIAAKGFAAVSMRAIAAEVGVQAGALYRYTPDKQTLLFDLMRSHMQDLLAQPVAPNRPPLGRLDHFARQHIRFHSDKVDAVFVSYMELRSLNAENFARIESLRRTYEERLSAIIESGKADGTFDVDDARIAARAIIAMLAGLTTWYRNDGALELDEVERIYVRLVRGTVGVI